MEIKNEYNKIINYLTYFIIILMPYLVWSNFNLLGEQLTPKETIPLSALLITTVISLISADLVIRSD